MEGRKIWGAILIELKSQLSSSTFKTWFSGSFALEYKKNTDKNLLIIAVKNSFIKEQIKTRYTRLISEISQKKKINNTETIFVVATQVTTKQLKNEPIFSGIASLSVIKERKSEFLNPNHCFENFVVGSSNNIAYLAAKQVAKTLASCYNPLLIYGPSGVGKTHLLQAIGNEVLNTSVEAKVLYVSAEKFTNDYIESLRARTQVAFRGRYRSVDLLLVDDVQFLAGKESTQDEFFYTFNDLYLSGRQIVLACDRHPKELGKLKDRLTSRFLGGMAVDIGMPDLEIRIAIIKSKCQEMKIPLEEETINYIAKSISGNVREIEGILTSALSLSKLSGGKTTTSEIVGVIEKTKVRETQPPSPQKMIEAVCNHFKINIEQLLGPSRKAPLVVPRQILMYLLRKRLHLSLVEIGEIIGGRDHSTVLYGIAKTESLVSQSRLKMDEVLRIESMIK